MLGGCATSGVVPGAGHAHGLKAVAGRCEFPASGSNDGKEHFTDRRYRPKRFGRGEDPSRDDECRAPNPERGLFAFRDLLAPVDLEELSEQGVSLIYGQALLADYR